MPHLLPRAVSILMLLAPVLVSATTLDEAFAHFRTCDFRGFFYDPVQALHPYFAERGLKPYKQKDGLYYFKVNDRLFGLPVEELIIPGTWDMHVVVFNLPLKKAQQLLKRQFGSYFYPSDESKAGKVPALVKQSGAVNRSALYCNEVDGGY